MSRGLDDAFTHLALIRETLRRYGRRPRLQAVKQQIHRFAGELLWAKFRQYATVQKEDLWYELIRRDPSEWKDSGSPRFLDR